MRITSILLICIVLSSCGNSTRTDPVTPAYFDLKGFFEQEALRLNKGNKTVIKTVSRNANKESGTVRVNWVTELALFTESDINKPAWKNSFKKISGPSKTEYTALENNLKTRCIAIIKISNRIKAIHIVNQTTNFLYTSIEKLDYYTDSAYSIKKQQTVKILGTNQYVVTGKLK
ncbi:MAG TPA: hypothetical protein VNI52_09630 [Sphingobacteriaceae bacterium]|nr:hypothetical protein [Sphingobacteriaceae bacterium]